MTNEEQELLIEYLVDAGEIFPGLDRDVETQFLDWYEVRQSVVSGETHYKAVLQAARVRNRSLERELEAMTSPPSDRPGVCDHGTPCGCYAEGYAAGLAKGSLNAGTTRWETWLGSARSWTTSTSRHGLCGGPRPGRSGLVMPIRYTKTRRPTQARSKHDR